MKVNSITIKQNEVMNKNMYFIYTLTYILGLIPQDRFIKTQLSELYKNIQGFYIKMF